MTPGLPAPTPPAAQGSALHDHGQTRIVTGEAVHLDVRVARLGSRALARIIDAVIQVVLYVILLIVFSIVASLLTSLGVVDFDFAVLSIVYIGALVVAMLGYPVLLETTTRGRTLGKLVLGLRVVRDDGGPVTFRHAATRGLIGFAVEWPGVLGAPLTWLATICDDGGEPAEQAHRGPRSGHDRHSRADTDRVGLGSDDAARADRLGDDPRPHRTR